MLRKYCSLTYFLKNSMKIFEMDPKIFETLRSLFKIFEAIILGSHLVKHPVALLARHSVQFGHHRERRQSPTKLSSTLLLSPAFLSAPDAS